jgi:hypothetical protein
VDGKASAPQNVGHADLAPEVPRFVNSGERQVWHELVDQHFDDDLVLANVRVTDRAKDDEATSSCGSRAPAPSS